MAYVNVYPSRINWENEPSINTPINAVNLNKIDYAVYEHDRTFATWDVTKANQSDLLLSVKSIDYDDETGVFIFTWQNGTTKTVDLNIEKIPVSFSMDAQGVITMTTEDGTQYTADIKTLITEYSFEDSAQIDFTVKDASKWANKSVGPLNFDLPDTETFDDLDVYDLPDKLKIYIPTNEPMVPYNNLGISNIEWYLESTGGIISQGSIGFSTPVTEYELDLTLSQYSNVVSVNTIIVTCNQIESSQIGMGSLRLEAEYPQTKKQITAIIKDGSITGSKLETNFLANCQAAQTGAETAQGLAENSAKDSEAYAIGTRGGVPVTSGDPAYHNNSKYYSELANPTSIANLTDVDIAGITNGQILKYNSTTQKFENANESSGGGTAASVTYDNTASGLIADDVQEAIDELNTIKATTTTVNNKHKVTNVPVDLTNWTTDTTSQSGTTLYKKQITLNHIYVDSPSVEIGAASGSVLPTTSQQESYDLILYCTCDDTVPCIYLYASDIPQTAFYINVEGAD